MYVSKSGRSVYLVCSVDIIVFQIVPLKCVHESTGEHFAPVSTVYE